MRKIKKLIVAVMAMAMMLGMLTVSASAAEYVDGGELYIVGDFNDWSFEKMDGADGVYTAEVELEAGKKYGYKFTLVAEWNKGEITDDGNNGGVNVYFTPETAGTYVFTVDTSKVVEGADATHWNGGAAISVEIKSDESTGDDTNTGDDTTGDDTTGDDTEKNPSEDTSDVETDSVVNITEDEIKELEDAVVVEGAEDKLVISVVPEDSADLDVIAAADVLKNVKYVAVDLKFESGNQPEEGTKITFPIAKIASVKDTAYVSVYRVDADKLKLIEVVKVTDGNITFEPDHFSTYVFAEANEADYNKYLNDQEAGVSLPIVGLIAVAALAGGCVVFSSKRKHA